MRTLLTFLVIVLLLAAFGTSIVSAETVYEEIFKVDILDDTHTDALYIQDGFVGWAPYPGTNPENPDPVSTTVNSVTITFDSGAYHQDRYRGSGDLTGVPYEALYRDSFWGRAADTNSQGLDITLSGLIPDQEYLVALYAFDYADWQGLQSCDWTANGEFAFNASWDGDLPGGDVPTAWDSFRYTVTVAADGNGEILLVSSAGEGTVSSTYWANCSALELYAVPEPGILAMLLGALLVAPLARRRG
ncbi:MAG: hypothetical protein JW818_03790 [Pirellulales bacterium]|nr:hypothetical protein [Pirellulales bacterium]